MRSGRDSPAATSAGGNDLRKELATPSCRAGLVSDRTHVFGTHDRVRCGSCSSAHHRARVIGVPCSDPGRGVAPRLAEALERFDEVGDVRAGLSDRNRVGRDRATKEPFAAERAVSHTIGRRAFEDGLICYPCAARGRRAGRHHHRSASVQRPRGGAGGAHRKLTGASSARWRRVSCRASATAASVGQGGGEPGTIHTQPARPRTLTIAATRNAAVK